MCLTDNLFKHGLEALGELDKITCAKCNYKTNSKGELKLHEHERHSNTDFQRLARLVIVLSRDYS